ncbi:MAG: 3,4-dihydroxy-2-butanone-4-phosphate synthase [Gammaproteobacteria bacterium]|nr:MAG: 3,4-dihydroxy-2-butanone-4-phosphate synthase [Gammaproteobacteria bacterium]
MNTIEELLAELAAGRMVVVMDDEDRENEGDLLMVASCVRPEDVNFMARYGRGLICLTLTRERCRELRLPLMVTGDGDHHGTSFTVSIEAAEGVTTGISAHDRAHTIRTAVASGTRPDDLRQPGHVFPLMAQPGGVLTRAGHTEAGCDLARLAGFEPAAVIVEILNEDGTMARRPDLERFAAAHGLKIGTIADLIRYRLHAESSIERVVDRMIDTEFGPLRMCWYEDHVHSTVHVALVRGVTGGSQPPLVRVHLHDTLRDDLGLRLDPHAWTLRSALQRIAAEDCGVVVLLRPPEAPAELIAAVQELDNGTVRADYHAQRPSVLRTYGIGAQILHDLGVTRMRVLSAPRQLLGIGAFGLEITGYVD